MALRKGTITESGIKIKWQETADGILFSDGKTAKPSPVNMDAKLAYKDASVPVPPVIIDKYKEIGASELRNLQDVENEVFRLKPGVYTGNFKLRNVKNITIDGMNSALFQGGDHAIGIAGNVSNLVLSNFSMRDVKDKQIFMEDVQSKSWKDGRGDFVDGITLLNIQAEGGGNLFHANGALFNGTHLGMIKNFKMKGCGFRNSASPGMVVYLGSAMGYDISDNVIYNVNYQNKDHNGIFMLRGNGVFHSNKITNYQGSFLRAWLFSHNLTPDLVQIFNNISYNSIKYGPFELQAPPEFYENGFRAANAKVYNNTAGKLNTSKDWHGQMLDVYNTGGTLEYYNNLGFEMNRSIGPGPSISTGITDMINYAGGKPTIIRNENNLYFDNAMQAVSDTINFKSLIKGIGAN